MSAKPGSHVVYAQGEELVVEWYDHGAHAPYESANLLIFDRAAANTLAHAIDVDPACSLGSIAAAVTNRFESYFEVKAFAIERGIPFEKKVDFQP